jgi:hypothetical protein
LVSGSTSIINLLYGEVPKLFVNGGTNLVGTVQLTDGVIRFTKNNVTWEATGIANNLPEWRADATGIKFGNYFSLPLRIAIGASENARFFSTGNVAIGNTVDAGFRLDVNGTVRSTSTITGNNLTSVANVLVGAILYGTNFSIATNGQTSFGAGGFNAPASALVAVTSTTQGFLPPRMTQTQRNAIASPAIGLEIYQTDATEGKYIYKSSGWTYIG